MSVRVLSDVWAHSKAEGGDLLVLLALADFADDKGKCWPAVETIGQKARMGERNVRKILRRLEVAGDIRMDRNDGRNGSNLYWVALGAERQGWLLTEGGEGEQKTASPEPGFRGRGNASAETPAPGFPQTVKEPSRNRQQTDGVEIKKIIDSHQELSDGRFVAKWDEWVFYRKSKRKPISLHAAKKQLEMLAEMTTEDAVEMINASIRNDWTGLFPPRKSAGKSATFA